MQQTILVVDDDKKTVDLIRLYLQKERYHVLLAFDGQHALDLARQESVNLMILDWMLPGIDGIEVCRQLRAESALPIILLTSRSTEDEKLLGLNLGADDYLTKPFSLGELEVRVGAILKRQREVTTAEKQRLVFEKLAIDPERREVTIDNQLIPLTALEFDLLRFLASHPGRVWRRSELIQEVWDYEYVGDQRVVDVHIGQILKKIEIDSSQPILIQTVRGVGYKFEAPSKGNKNQ